MGERCENAAMVSELEKAAMRGDAMPDGLCLPDQSLYQALRCLYRSYRQGAVTRELAKREKAAMLKEYGSMMQWYKIYRETAEMRNRFGTVLAKVNKEGCECCQLVAKVFDGRVRQTRVCKREVIQIDNQ